MKKYIILFAFVGVYSTVSAQIKTNKDIAQNDVQNFTPFLDASSSSFWNSTTNNGKGLVFPRVDLTQLDRILGPSRPGTSNAPTRYDGMLVYNTVEGTPAIGASKTPHVTKGFYYYKNETTDLQGGYWVAVGGGATSAKGADYSENAVATGENFFVTASDSKPVYRKMIQVTFGNGTNGATYAKLPNNAFGADPVFIRTSLIDPATGKVILSSSEYKKSYTPQGTTDTGEYIFASYNNIYTTLKGTYNLIAEYYTK